MLAPTVIDSRIEHVGDDMFNVQNTIDIVLGFDKEKDELIVADKSFGTTFPVTATASGLCRTLRCSTQWPR